MTPVLPPEARLLLYATRAPSAEDDRAISELVASPLNWRVVGELLLELLAALLGDRDQPGLVAVVRPHRLDQLEVVPAKAQRRGARLVRLLAEQLQHAAPAHQRRVQGLAFDLAHASIQPAAHLLASWPQRR